MALEPRFRNRATRRERYNADDTRVEACVGGFGSIGRDAGWHENWRDAIRGRKDGGEDV